MLFSFSSGPTAMLDEIAAWRNYLLTRHYECINPTISPKRVSMVAMKIRYLIEQLVNVEVKPSWVTQPHSRVAKRRVMNLLWEAGGNDKDCVVYALLMYFRRKASTDLTDADLHHLRKLASEHMAKLIVESVSDHEYLFTDILLKRYSILRDGKVTPPTSAVELAVDFHAIRVIATHNYQECITAIWRGYYTIQYNNDGTLAFGQYGNLLSRRFRDHFDVQRIKVPLYQNIHNLVFTVLFIIFYTMTVNKRNTDGSIDVIEGLLYGFSYGFFFDGITKIYRGGLMMMTFWHAYNLILYMTFCICSIIRILELTGYSRIYVGDDILLSYDILACMAPFLYCRQLLHLNFFRFFGTMIIILEKMIKETAIFFLLLVVVSIGFLQSFSALNPDEEHMFTVDRVMHFMTQTVLNSPDFEFFLGLKPPFGIALFYIYTSVVSVLLLNILIALFNQAYSVVTDHAVDEFLALFSNKTLEYIRAPDEDTFCPPFNLVRVLFLLPCEPFLPKKVYRYITHAIMKILFFPNLCLIAYYESRFQSRSISKCRSIGLSDGESSSGWDIERDFDPQGSGWAERVKSTIPNIEEDEMYLLRRLEREVKALGDGLGVKQTSS